MVLLFFVLDLRTLSPPLFAQLKQCLLELANLYALSAPTFNLKYRNVDSSLQDRIGLCYLRSSACFSSNEQQQLKIVYSPRGKSFNLRDFHYAVNHLPSDYYLPPILEDSGPSLLHDIELSCIISDEVLDSTRGKEIELKIILISSCLLGNMDSNAKKTLLDAANKCISVEFVFLELKSSQICDVSENINKFRGQICDLENCSFNAYLPDEQVFNGLAKKWLMELKESAEELLQAHFLFQKTFVGSFNRICCRLCGSVNQIMDRFSPCKAHTCHDIQRNNRDGYGFTYGLFYHVKEHNVEQDNTVNDSKVLDEYGLLAEGSLQCRNNFCLVPSTIIFNIIERTSLASLSEGVVIGRPYIVTPSAVQETDTAQEESDMCHWNNMLFQGLCRALNSVNQGLICWSFCNLDKMRETALIYYYILQPSDSGLMLLRRLAGAEEILPFPDANTDDSSNTEEIDCSIQQCLEEIELRDYNPLQHSGGFHQKLSQLVEEGLHPGLVAPEISTTPAFISLDDVSVPLQPSEVRNVAALPDVDVLTSLSSGKTNPLNHTEDIDIPLKAADENEKGITCLAQEWEQLIVGSIPKMDLAHSEPTLGTTRTSPPSTRRPLDTRTSNILERLGNPKQNKTKAINTNKILGGLATYSNGTKENHPISIGTADQGLTTTSNLMKPIFQRLKRKQR
ncbi:unnamed protein product [Amaranthus hypochondriacus]